MLPSIIAQWRFLSRDNIGTKPSTLQHASAIPKGIQTFWWFFKIRFPYVSAAIVFDGVGNSGLFRLSSGNTQDLKTSIARLLGGVKMATRPKD
jgi:hypothetical protein